MYPSVCVYGLMTYGRISPNHCIFFRAEKMWEGEKDRKQRLADKRKAELKHLREKLMTGTRDAVLASDKS